MRFRAVLTFEVDATDELTAYHVAQDRIHAGSVDTDGDALSVSLAEPPILFSPEALP